MGIVFFWRWDLFFAHKREEKNRFFRVFVWCVLLFGWCFRVFLGDFALFGGVFSRYAITNSRAARNTIFGFFFRGAVSKTPNSRSGRAVVWLGFRRTQSGISPAGRPVGHSAKPSCEIGLKNRGSTRTPPVVRDSFLR